MNENEIDPLLIRFTHSKIRPYFSGCGRRVEDTIQEIIRGELILDNLPKICVITDGLGNYYSLNNRRLYVFKTLRNLGYLQNRKNPNTVPCRFKSALPRELKKYTITSCSLNCSIMNEKNNTSSSSSLNDDEDKQEEEDQEDQDNKEDELKESFEDNCNVSNINLNNLNINSSDNNTNSDNNNDNSNNTNDSDKKKKSNKNSKNFNEKKQSSEQKGDSFEELLLNLQNNSRDEIKKALKLYQQGKIKQSTNILLKLQERKVISQVEYDLILYSFSNL